MLNPKTDAISEFPVPTGGNIPNPALSKIAEGPDGNLWFGEDDYTSYYLDKINPTTHVITQIPSSFYVYEIATGANGNLWLSAAGLGGLDSFNPTTDAFTAYTLPSSEFPGITDIASDPQGNLWLSSAEGKWVGEINAATGALNSYKIASGPLGPTDLGPISVDHNGTISFVNYNRDYINQASPGEIDILNPSTGAISRYQTVGEPFRGITPGPDGNLWFSLDGNGAAYPDPGSSSLIASLNPTTGVITTYPTPPGDYAVSLAVGPDGNLWFNDDTNNSAIGVATLTNTQFVVTQEPPASIPAGSPFGLTVQAENSSGGLMTSYNGPVTLEMDSNPGNGIVSGTVTVTAVNGVATFTGLTLTTAATGDTLAVTGGGIGWGVTTPISVTPLAVFQVAFTQEPPSSVSAGVPFTLVAEMEDQYGNLVPTATNLVNVALASGPAGATLGGTTSIHAVDGVATFSTLTLTRAASNYALQLSSTGFSQPVSSVFAVTPTYATGLMILQQPTSVAVNTGFTMVVEAVDVYGNLETADELTVNLTLDNNPTNAKLKGTTSVSFVNGVATFTGLTITKAGTGYTILISSKYLTSMDTNPFNVT
jgi:streptogramin lyase